MWQVDSLGSIVYGCVASRYSKRLMKGVSVHSQPDQSFGFDVARKGDRSKLTLFFSLSAEALVSPPMVGNIVDIEGQTLTIIRVTHQLTSAPLLRFDLAISAVTRCDLEELAQLLERFPSVVSDVSIV
jgi:hypothetical protein